MFFVFQQQHMEGTIIMKKIFNFIKIHFHFNNSHYQAKCSCTGGDIVQIIIQFMNLLNAIVELIGQLTSII